MANELNERSRLINKLVSDHDARVSYTWAKISVILSSQIKALRRRRNNMTQTTLAEASGMKQSRISAMERPGETKFTVETLIRLASAFKVGLLIKFVSFSEMLAWENEYTQDFFTATEIDNDHGFLQPEISHNVCVGSGLLKDPEPKRHQVGIHSALPGNQETSAVLAGSQQDKAIPQGHLGQPGVLTTINQNIVVDAMAGRA